MFDASKKPQLIRQLKFEGAWPMAVSFLGDSNRLAAGNQEGRICIWDLTKQSETSPGEKPTANSGDSAPDLAPVRCLEGHANGVTHLLATVDGKRLISASLDHTIRMWDLASPAEGETEIVLDGETREQQAKRQGKKEVSPAPGVRVEIQKHSQVLAGHAGWVTSLGISRDGSRLISGDDNSLAIVWDLALGKEIARRKGVSPNQVCSAALTADGKTAFTGEWSHSRTDFDRPPAQANIWDVDNGTNQVDILAVQFPNVKKRDNSYGYSQIWNKFTGRGLVTAEFSPDGKLLAVGQGGETDTGKVHLLDVDTGKLVRTISGHQYGITDLAFTADGKFLLSCGRDTTLRILQVSDGKEVASLNKPRGGQFKDWLSSLAISPEEDRIAATDIAGLVHVWSMT